MDGRTKVGWSLEAAREGDRIEEGYRGLWMGVVVLLPRTSLLWSIGGRIKAAPGENGEGDRQRVGGRERNRGNDGESHHHHLHRARTRVNFFSPMTRARAPVAVCSSVAVRGAHPGDGGPATSCPMETMIVGGRGRVDAGHVRCESDGVQYRHGGVPERRRASATRLSGPPCGGGWPPATLRSAPGMHARELHADDCSGGC
jgi:hypothetical protein